MSDAIQQQWYKLTQPSGETAVPDDAPLLIGLPDRRVIEVSGSEARAFLQAILTQDILALDDHAATFSALCNAKGRALGLLRLVGHEGRFFLITRADIAENLQKRLQMYVLRRDVDLRPADRWVALGVMLPAPADCPFDDQVACEVIERLARQGGGDDSPRWPADVDEQGRLFLREDIDGICRIAILGEYDRMTPLVEHARDASLAPQAAWDRAEIEDRLPEVTSQTVEHYVPQWINLDELGAFSLKKGCYPGQEVIARMHYLGKPNRRLFAGHVLALAPPAPGTPVETADGTPAGEVVRSAPLPDASGSRLLVVIKLKHRHDALRIDGLALSLDPADTLAGNTAEARARH